MKNNNSFGSAITPIRLANIFKILPLLAMLSVVGCSEDSTEDDGGDDGSGNTVVETFGYSVDPTDPTTARFAYDSYVTLTHLSENATSLELVLEGATAFLKDNFDSEATDLSTEVDESKGTTSSATQESVVFTTPGYATVTLKAEFTENISDGTSGISAKQSEDNDGYWKLVKEFEVPVFSKELSPVITVSDGDDEEYEFTADELTAVEPEAKVINIYVGESVTFTDSTVEEGYDSTSDKLKLSALGSALGRTWSYDGEDVTITNDTEESTTLTFSAEGVYEAFYVTVNRTKPTAVATTTGELYIPVKITVTEVPLTPVTMSNLVVTNADGGALNEIVMTTDYALGVNGGSVTATGFSVSVTNGGSSVDGITVESVSVDSDDATKLILTLSDNIYSDDEVTLSFTASDDSTIAYGQYELDDFGATTVTNGIGSVLNPTYYNFTGLATGTTFNNSAISTNSWYSETVAADFTCVDDPTGAENNDGAVVMLSVSNAEKTYATYTRNTDSAKLSISEGSYKISVRFYLPSVISSGSYQLTYNPTAVNTWTVIKSENYADIATGEWVTISETITYDTDYTDARLRIAFANSTVGYLAAGDTIYFDDIELVPVRPTITE